MNTVARLFVLGPVLVAASLSIGCSAGDSADETASTDTGTAADEIVGGSISRGEVMSRARNWIGNNQYQYTQSGYYPDPQGRGYRGDCSGFVSMAWHLTSSLNTVSLVTSGTARLISDGELQPGDALGILGAGTGGDNGHVMLFAGWSNPQHTRFDVLEQNGDSNANEPHHSNYSWPLRDPRGTYRAYRYVNITGGGSVSAPPPPSNGGCSVHGDGKLYCANTGNAPMRGGPRFSSGVVNTLRSTSSWFDCWGTGDRHAGGNTTWYHTLGDDNGNYGWIPGVDLQTPDSFDANPSAHGLRHCR